MKVVKKHTGSLKAARQQKVLKVLKRGGWYSSLKIVLRAGQYIPNVAEAVSALRANGVPLEKRPVPGTRMCEWRIARRVAA